MTDQPVIDARRARSFGDVAAEYDRGRPSYSADAIDWLLGAQALDVVDLGAGTGKLTSAVCAAAAGHRVTAVEPLDDMRALLEANLPEVTVVAARAEETGLREASADAVIAGAAFHWFERPRVFTETTRILRPGGRLGLLGSRIDKTTPVAARLREALAAWQSSGRSEEHSGRLQGGRSGHWPDADELGRWFAEVDEVRTFPYVHTLDRARLQDLAVSHSRLAILPIVERRQALDDLAAFWDGDPDLAGRESVQIPYETVVLRAREPLAGSDLSN